MMSQGERPFGAVKHQPNKVDGPQNIYDDPAFFEGFKDLRQNDRGLNGALEIPALRDLLPALAGKRVLDLGCGFGEFARFAREEGAASVMALDASEKMLTEAHRLTNDHAIVYLHRLIETFVPEARSFDLVVSSMALHYVRDYGAVTQRVFEALRSGGRFVFSVEHPVCTANPVGWVRDDEGNVLYWPLDRYQEEGERTTTWFVAGVRKYHRTVSSYVNALTANGFHLERLNEPLPTAEALALRPAMATESRRPPVLLLAALRP